jgi:hypothetical protein
MERHDEKKRVQQDKSVCGRWLQRTAPERNFRQHRFQRGNTRSLCASTDAEFGDSHFAIR